MLPNCVSVRKSFCCAGTTVPAAVLGYRSLDNDFVPAQHVADEKDGNTTVAQGGHHHDQI
jgi:hypothetical protein